MNIIKSYLLLKSKNKSFLIGLMAGILLSFMIMPFFEDCHSSSSQDEHISSPSSSWYEQIVSHDYDPVVRMKHRNITRTTNQDQDDNDVNNPSKAKVQLTPDNKLIRPRFAAIELGIKEHLLVVVLSSEETFNTLGKAVNRTLLGHMNANTDEMSHGNTNSVIYLVESSSLTRSTPSKPLMNSNSVMLIPRSSSQDDHYLLNDQVPYYESHNHNSQTFNFTPKYISYLSYLLKPIPNSLLSYIESYNFIFMTSDRSYVKSDQLESYVSQFSMSQDVFVTPQDISTPRKKSGVNGEEKKNEDEITPESGVLFSATLLLKCNLDHACLSKRRNVFSHDSQYSFKSYQFNELNLNQLNLDHFHNSLSTYPVTSIDVYYYLHLQWSQYAYNQTCEQLKKLENQMVINNENHIFHDSSESADDSLSWPIGISSPHKPTNRFDVIRWSFYNESHSFMPNDFDVISPLNQLQQKELHLIKSQISEWINENYSDKLAQLGLKQFKDFRIVNFYRKFDATRGLEYIIDVRLREFANMKRFHLLKPLNKIELIPSVPYVTENIRIVLLLPIRSGEEIESASSFLNQYANVCLKRQNHQTVLLLILIYQPNEEPKDVYGHIKAKASQIQNKYKASSAKIAWISLNSAKDRKVPSELAYIDYLARKFSSTFTNSLILHCRANMILSLDFLNRVRLNTIVNYQVFFPIPFVEFRLRSQVKPLKNFDVRKDNGYFDISNYNHVSFYLSDFINARKALQNDQDMRLKSPMLRFEQDLEKDIYYDSDIDLFQMFLFYNKAISRSPSKKGSPLFLMRAIEPELKLKHEGFSYDCLMYESNKYSLENCLHRNVIGLGTKQQLASLIVDDNEDEDGLELDDNDNNIF